MIQKQFSYQIENFKSDFTVKINEILFLNDTNNKVTALNSSNFSIIPSLTF